MNPVIPARNISPRSVLESSEGHLATTNYKNGVQLVRSLGDIIQSALEEE